MKTASLEISGARFEFRIDDNNWCRMELHTEDESIQLGADTWEILKERILGAATILSNSSEPEWILTLAEKHCALYRQNIDGMNQFYWINGEAKKIWESGLVSPINMTDLKTN